MLNLSKLSSVFRVTYIFLERKTTCLCYECSRELDSEITTLLELERQNKEAFEQRAIEMKELLGREPLNHRMRPLKKGKKLSDLAGLKLKKEKLIQKIEDLAFFHAIRIESCPNGCDFFKGDKGSFGDKNLCFTYSQTANDAIISDDGTIGFGSQFNSYSPPSSRFDWDFKDCQCKYKCGNFEGSDTANHLMKMATEASNVGINHIAVDLTSAELSPGSAHFATLCQLHKNKIRKSGKNSITITASIFVQNTGRGNL